MSTYYGSVSLPSKLNVVSLPRLDLMITPSATADAVFGHPGVPGLLVFQVGAKGAEIVAE